MGNVAGGALAKRRKPEILAAIAQGKPLQAIAHEIGYTDSSAIVHRIGTDPDYLRAMQVSAHAKLEKREAELETAPDNVSVTRADRLLGHARWVAERLHPDRWGQRPSVQVNVDARQVVVEPVLDKLLDRIALHNKQPETAIAAPHNDE